jgi:hypothetical protein
MWARIGPLPELKEVAEEVETTSSALWRRPPGRESATVSVTAGS